MARWMPRKRTILGGTLAVGLGVGLWLSGKLPQMGSGFGLGSGGDGVLGKPDTSGVAVQAGDETKKSDSGDRDARPKRTDAEPLDDVLTILVEDRHYAVWKKTRKGNGYFPAELNELIPLALDAKPNDQGLRVRIVRSETARLTAWTSLQSELAKAGVPVDAIVVQKEIVK